MLFNLNLSETIVGDDCLGHLKNLPDLQRLDLRGTRVTDDGITRLQKALPRLEVFR